MSGSVLLQQAASAGLGDYAGDLLRSLLALLGVGVLGYAALRMLAQRGLGRSAGPVQVLQRVVLEPRRTLYVVRAGERVLLLGCGETGAPALVAELSGEPASAEQVRSVAASAQHADTTAPTGARVLEVKP